MAFQLLCSMKPNLLPKPVSVDGGGVAYVDKVNGEVNWWSGISFLLFFSQNTGNFEDHCLATERKSNIADLDEPVW